MTFGSWLDHWRSWGQPGALLIRNYSGPDWLFSMDTINSWPHIRLTLWQSNFLIGIPCIIIMFSIAISLEARNLHASWHEVMMGSGVRSISISGRPGSYYWISPEQPSSSPSARSRHVAVYDDAHGVMLVAGLTTPPRMRHLTRANDIRQFLRGTCGWNNREVCCLCVYYFPVSGA